MMQRIFIILITSIFLWSCETEFTPDNGQFSEDVVVEGYIEGGQRPTVPVIMLTKSQAYFSTLNANDLNNLFVHNAEVTVSNGSETVNLTEVCLQDLTPEQQGVIANLLGVETGELAFNFCFYTDLSFSMQGEIGRQYDLNIKVNNKELSATTTIPQPVFLDSIKFAPVSNDTLRELRAFISDPADEANYYRYFTAQNNSQLLPGLQSVSDDKLFNGIPNFEFILSKSQPRNEEVNLETFGYFTEGDTVTLKFTNIDKAHFDFWNTLEYNMSSQGPFSSYTKVSSNIKGGLGVWGGYTAQYIQQVVPVD